MSIGFHIKSITMRIINKTRIQVGMCKAEYNVFMYINCSGGSLVENNIKKI